MHQNKASTRKDYVRYLAHLEEKYDHLPVVKLERPAVIAIRKTFRGKPRTANFVVQIISVLMQQAIDMGLRQANPAARPVRL